MEVPKKFVRRRAFIQRRHDWSSTTPSTKSQPFSFSFIRFKGFTTYSEIRFKNYEYSSIIFWREMIHRCLLLIAVLIIESRASSTSYFSRTLAEQSKVSPSPSPSYGEFASGASDFQETCNSVPRSCQLKNIAACLPYSLSGTQESWLLVANNGESPLNVKIMILPANNTIKDIQLSSHQMEKINISSYIGSTSAIALNAGDGDCIIHVEALAPHNNRYQKYPSSGTYLTPINGIYLVILVVFVSGGTLACFKLRNIQKHVRYHELEMGNSTQKIEEEEGWDQDWDEEWGEEKNSEVWWREL